MALIVEYHVVADMYPVGGTAFSAGMLLEFVAGTATVTPSATSSELSLGIAGDSALDAEGQTTAYSAQLTIGANGQGNRWTENRVSDFFDETTASQKVTVYNGGGKFWISSDLFDTNGSGVTSGVKLQVSTGVAGEWVEGAGDAAGEMVGLAVGSVQGYDSGVPGTDSTMGSGGSITLGDYVPVILRI